VSRRNRLYEVRDDETTSPTRKTRALPRRQCDRILFLSFCLEAELTAGGINIVTFFAPEGGDSSVLAEDGKEAFLAFA
jgi:hypothetical protein